MKEKRGPRGPYAKKPLAERFAAKWKADANGCHIWQGHIIWSGYGSMHTGDVATGYKQILAHRLAWELNRGPIPNGMSVLHKCDVRPCVNPEHLFLGTLDDNMKDMVAKGRSKLCGGGGFKGEDHGRAILTGKQVLKIREQRRAGVRLRVLADRYGVSISAIWTAATGKNWSHLNTKED